MGVNSDYVWKAHVSWAVIRKQGPRDEQGPIPNSCEPVWEFQSDHTEEFFALHKRDDILF